MVLALKIAAHVGPDEGPTAGNFQFGEVPGFEEPLAAGHVHLRLTHVSVDPWYLGLIKPGLYSWCQPIPVGGVMYGTCISTVFASSDPALVPGDVVSGFLPLQAECRVQSAAGLTKIGAASPEEALSIFGGPALTAFFGLKDVASPKSGDVVCISAAAGSVGSIAGQLCKERGCRVIGFAGTDAKCGVLTSELGFDAAINYKNGDLSNALRAALQALPDPATGVDVFWDNTSGAIADAVYEEMSDHGRVVVCGNIASYVPGAGKTEAEGSLQHRNHLVLERRLRVEGILVSEFFPRIAEAMPTLAALHESGNLKARAHVVEGFRETVNAFLGLFEGANTGKTIVRA